MDELNKCKNCKHHVKYYFWFKNKLLYARKGRCRVAKKSKSLVECDGSCEKWETDDSNQKAQAETFEQVLRQMARRIEEIMYILKNAPR